MQTTVKVAYLVNCYPSVSHSFIRREITALETLGVEIERFSIRRTKKCPDAADQIEQCKTTVLLEKPISLLLGFLKLALRNPIRVIAAGVSALRLSWNADRSLLAHLGYFFEACRLVMLMQGRSIKHIHAHFGTNPPAVALLCSVLGDVTFSFTVHGPEEFDRPLALKLKQKIEAASFVVAISSYGRSQLMRWCDRDEWSKIVVVRCGVDSSYLGYETSQDARPNSMVCVGRLCEQKGQLLLLDAMRVLCDRGVQAQLTLAGDGDMRPAIEARIRELELANVITITGWLSGDEVRAALLDNQVMVLPSFAEGLPVVIMEALALGRPVISTYVAGIPELVADGRNGWLVPAGSHQRLADAMQEALSTPTDQIRSMGKAGKNAVAEKHSISTEAQRLKGFFDEFGTNAAS